MEHYEANQLLLERVAGHLNEDQLAALDAHTEGCEECRGWIATHQLLMDSLRDASSRQHLDSQDLCEYALDSPDLTRAAHDRCEHHLRECVECSAEVQLVRCAVRETTAEVLPLRDFAAQTKNFVTSRAGVALAAALVLVIAGLVMTSRVETSAPDEYRLVGQSVSGNQGIKANRSIFVEATELEAGSKLELESQIVAFGNGFSVETNATLVVSGNQPKQENSSYKSQKHKDPFTKEKAA